MSCMLCQKYGRIFNVYTNYGTANHNVKDDLVEIFGVDAEPFLDSRDCVCNACMNMLDNMAELKRRLWSLIRHTNPDCKIKLSKIWKIFASLQIEEEDNDEDHTIPCRTPTPSKLLSLTYSRVYNCELENQIADVERNRSMSRASSGVGRSDASETSEVKNIFSGRRHKGRNISSGVSEFSHSSFPRRRGFDSPSSDCSYTNFYTINKSAVKRKGVEYDEYGRLVRKRTRSVSREQEKETRHLEMMESSKFYCNQRYCRLYFEDVDVLNQHRIMDHEILALYFCEECRQKYTSLEHLKLHQRCHDTVPFLCPLCQCAVRNQEALQVHLEEHLIYSVPCKYCDKFFLSKQLCKNHLKSDHEGRKERNVCKERIILDRLDKGEGNNVAPINSETSNNTEYTFHVLPYTDMECNEGDLDVTVENLRLMHMDICTDEDTSTDVTEI